MSKIHIMCGLPGSGKTSFAAEMAKEKKAVVYDCDKWIIKEKKKLIDLLVQIKKDIEKEEYKVFILDGLFLTNEDYEKVLHFFSPTQSVVFHYWIPSREICLYNDKNRREKDASITIKYAKTEVPDLLSLKRINQHVNVIFHETKRKDE